MSKQVQSVCPVTQRYHYVVHLTDTAQGTDQTVPYPLRLDLSCAKCLGHVSVHILTQSHSFPIGLCCSEEESSHRIRKRAETLTSRLLQHLVQSKIID